MLLDREGPGVPDGIAPDVAIEKKEVRPVKGPEFAEGREEVLAADARLEQGHEKEISEEKVVEWIDFKSAANQEAFGVNRSVFTKLRDQEAADKKSA